MITPERQCDCALRVLRELQRVGFYGKLVMQFTEGNIVMFRTEQTALLDAVSDGAPLVCVVQPCSRKS